MKYYDATERQELGVIIALAADPIISPKSADIYDFPTAARIRHYIATPDSGSLKPETMAKNLDLPMGIVLAELNHAYGKGLVRPWRYRVRQRLQAKIRTEQRYASKLAQQFGDNRCAIEASIARAGELQARIQKFNNSADILHRPAKRLRPPSLIEALCGTENGRAGGLCLKDNCGGWLNYGAEIHDIIDTRRLTVPLYGILLNKFGREPEEAAEFAMEKGYVPPGDSYNGVDLPRFVELFERDYTAWRQKDIHRRVFSAADQDAVEDHLYTCREDDEEQCPPDDDYDDNICWPERPKMWGGAALPQSACGDIPF